MTDYLKGARIITADEIRTMLAAHPQLATATVYIGDGAYLALERSALEAFIADYRGEIRPWRIDVNDCDNSSAIVRGRLLEACGDLDYFPQDIYTPEVRHWPVNGEFHDALLVLEATEGILFHEPQTGILHAVADKVRSAEAIWG